jgi:branched-chain amino acid transport system permease protein
LEIFLFILISGISFGLILFLLASGQSLILGLMKTINLAHGALFMVGAYVGLAAAQYTHNYLIGVIAGAVSAALLGLFMQLGFLQHLYKKEEAQILLTIGFVYILMNITLWIFGGIPLAGITPSIFSGTIPLGDLYFPIYRLFLIGFGILLAVLLYLFQEKTKIGAIVRAGMDNREIVGTLGINLKVIFAGLFVFGSFVAGMCGLMAAPLMGINLDLGFGALLLALLVVVIGGTGSIQGCLIGGLIIGLLNALGAAYFPQYSYFIIYVALIIILLVKPSGIKGRIINIQRVMDASRNVPRPRKPAEKEAQAGDSPKSRFVMSARSHSIIPYAAIGLLLVILPGFLGEYPISVMTQVLVFAIFAMSLDLISGYGGLPSLGHAVFLGVAGYTIGILSVRLGINLIWITIPAAILVTVIFSAVIGFISLRVSGVYFLLVTLAFGELLANVAIKWSAVTGGTDGLPKILRPDLGIVGFSWTSLNFYYLVFVIFIICFVILYIVVHSSFGRALIGVRENETRMRALGFNTWSLKYVAIIVAGAVAGCAGILYAYLYGTMVPSNMAIQASSTVLLMTIIGGSGTLYGPFIGAATIVVIEEISKIYVPDRWPLILGAIFIICVMGVRGGFAPYFSRFWGKVRFKKSVGIVESDLVKD